MTHLVHERFGDILIPTTGPEFDPLNWPKAGAYPLFPYHNRLVGAAFEHEGRHYEVLPHPALGSDAQHGPAHRRRWHVVSHEPDRIELALNYEADADWPFDFRAVQRFVLADGRLDVELALTNTGNGTMPGGFGWHPYFAAGLGNAVSCVAAEIWPVSSMGIPSGAAPQTRDANKPFPSEGFTVFLSEWGAATATLDGGAEITLTAGPELPHLVAHRMPAYVCLEPVSHVAGAFGFPPEAKAAAGLFVLQPGGERSARLSLGVTGSTA
ncbi:aldose 1-epimerase [Neorhizobium sp. Rsf11]|uniref:Aldose 1-epimerase n=1 Tax=Neorhizobium phenanthreniclasticum TaxID=3157917 RepID=A0ABV0M999_9HYPH